MQLRVSRRLCSTILTRLLVKARSHGLLFANQPKKLITPMMNRLLAIATLNNADATKPLPIPGQQPLLQSLRGVFSLVEPVVPRRPATHGVICGWGRGPIIQNTAATAPTAASRNTTSSVRRRARLYTLHTRGVTAAVRAPRVRLVMHSTNRKVSGFPVLTGENVLV